MGWRGLTRGKMKLRNTHRRLEWRQEHKSQVGTRTVPLDTQHNPREHYSHRSLWKIAPRGLYSAKSAQLYVAAHAKGYSGLFNEAEKSTVSCLCTTKKDK